MQLPRDSRHCVTGLQRQRPPDDVIPKYLESERTASGSDAHIPDDEQRGYTLRTQGRQMSISCGEPLVLEFEVDCPGAQASATAGFVLYSLFDVPVVGGSSKVQMLVQLALARR